MKKMVEGFCDQSTARHSVAAGARCARCPSTAFGGPPPPMGEDYIERAITIFMISLLPPKMRLMRLSRNMRAIG